ncbi:hypothetical protein BDP81DRAFT_492306 [Colletotrichum phormii]|uniref:Uncharacterized protein n=1 Tax=Colletotrichum phormii TaxID=359342 RepID=A0AAI9ZBB8_9PEZI|nr:uncharacterized protein BDP81DRAFT_513569 [Colletotrichum phormii]XP_060444012.1 uncharacterized protein BDP81DRAFT_492306 [Colletotrichum phormii]KAK1613507.1 hypothetical protein BDP81DRAFT_513569 [Colletotrichum phormii]KAK1635405.1 hypothetical protein BDP81DRAFT_492306 [Colletotrichum phormii]
MASNDFVIPAITLDAPDSQLTNFTADRAREIAATLNNWDSNILDRETRLRTNPFQATEGIIDISNPFLCFTPVIWVFKSQSDLITVFQSAFRRNTTFYKDNVKDKNARVRLWLPKTGRQPDDNNYPTANLIKMGEGRLLILTTTAYKDPECEFWTYEAAAKAAAKEASAPAEGQAQAAQEAFTIPDDFRIHGTVTRHFPFGHRSLRPYSNSRQESPK